MHLCLPLTLYFKISIENHIQDKFFKNISKDVKKQNNFNYDTQYNQTI